MSKELLGKEVTCYGLGDCTSLQNLGCINMYRSDFDKLHGGRIVSVVSRGNVIRVKFDNGMNLLLAPEYGGKVLYHKESAVPSKYHLKLCFDGDSALTVTLTGLGVIQALTDEQLENSYVYRRDFSTTASPTDEKEFTFERFSKELSGRKVNVKSVLVGKDAVVVGLGNSAFQDILFRAKVHPKRKASSLNEAEKQALFNAVKNLIQERLKQGGKSQFVDFYGKLGGYNAEMGSNMKGKTCTKCGSQIESLSLGGGQTFYCPGCQK